MGEHSTGEIAAFLKITVNGVKTRLYAARRRLRKHMGDIEEKTWRQPVRREMPGSPKKSAV
jgi:DNA-directed RNA polymerase specialized sigma24 family protein